MKPESKFELDHIYEKLQIYHSEKGQSIVLLALLIIALIAAVGLAVDGGNALNKRRITQNAADASALGGVHYIALANDPTEDGLLANINEAVEANGVPDTDSVPANHINENVTAYYTDAEGDRLVWPNCSHVGTCENGNPSIPPLQAYGLEVEVDNSGDTFFIRVIGINTFEVGAEAVAIASGLFPESLREAALLALGDDCTLGDKPILFNGDNSEVIGLAHSNSSFYVSGGGNHLHGQVTVKDEWKDDNPGNNLFEPGTPIPHNWVDDPFGNLQVIDFAPGGSIMQSLDPAFYHDVSNHSGIVNKGSLELAGLFDPVTVVITDGVYYAGDLEIDLNASGMQGNVTLVSSNTIVVGGSDMMLTSYLMDPYPPLLMFSSYQPAEPCKDKAIDIGGSEGSVKPEVYHEEIDPGHSGCPEVPEEAACYELGSQVYTGLIYAPRGRVFFSGSKSTIFGAIVAWTIELNGSNALVVNNPQLYPQEAPRISLVE